MKTIAKVAQSLKSKATSKKSVNEFMDFLVARKSIVEGLSQTTFTVLHGIPVIVHDDLFKATGRKYAAMGKDLIGRPSIYVESDIFNLESDVIKFIVSHEEGHVYLHGDVENMTGMVLKRELKAFFGGVAKEEIEADRYAAERIGYRESIVAMRKFSEHLAFKGMSKRIIAELEGRIAILEQDARRLNHIK